MDPKFIQELTNLSPAAKQEIFDKLDSIKDDVFGLNPARFSNPEAREFMYNRGHILGIALKDQDAISILNALKSGGSLPRLAAQTGPYESESISYKYKQSSDYLDEAVKKGVINPYDIYKLYISNPDPSKQVDISKAGLPDKVSTYLTGAQNDGYIINQATLDPIIRKYAGTTVEDTSGFLAGIPTYSLINDPYSGLLTEARMVYGRDVVDEAIKKRIEQAAKAAEAAGSTVTTSAAEQAAKASSKIASLTPEEFRAVSTFLETGQVVSQSAIDKYLAASAEHGVETVAQEVSKRAGKSLGTKGLLALAAVSAAGGAAAYMNSGGAGGGGTPSPTPSPTPASGTRTNKSPFYSAARAATPSPTPAPTSTPTPTSAEIQLAQETGAPIGGPATPTPAPNILSSMASSISSGASSIWNIVTSLRKPSSDTATATPPTTPSTEATVTPEELTVISNFTQMVDTDPIKANEGLRAYSVKQLEKVYSQRIELDAKYQSIINKPLKSRTPDESEFVNTASTSPTSYAFLSRSLDARSKIYADDIQKITAEISSLQTKEANKPSPELAQAQIDLVRAQTASANASAANSGASSALSQAQAALVIARTPLEIKTAEQNLKNTELQFQVTTNEVEKSKLALLDAQLQHRQVTVIDTLAEDAKNGKITPDQYITAVATIKGDTATLSNRIIEADRAKRETRKLDLEEANANRDFALRQTTAVAQNAMEQARLDLQRTAEARAAVQARAQNMQALTAAQTQRQAAYNQAATEYERFGVATPNRIQGLQDLKAPLPAAQAAGMLGLDVNSPEFKAVYDTYSMALAPGQGAQQPVPAVPAPAPAPAPNPVTNSIPLISMPSMGNTPYLTQALGGLKTGYSPA